MKKTFFGNISTRGVLFAALSVFALAPFAFTQEATAPTPTPVERYGQLHIADGQIVDQAGNPVVLRGMSYGWSQWFGKFWTPASVKWLRDDWNVTVVRLAMAVDSGGYMTSPESSQFMVERMVDAAIENGLYVIVDWHAHDPHPEEAAEFFAHMAEKYGDKPNLIWETFNEPLPQYGWSEVLKPYHEKVIAAIRKYDPDNIIVLGTRTWSQNVDEAANDPVAGDNLAYTLHFYTGTHPQSLRDKADYAISKGLTLFVTEWGASEADGNGRFDKAKTKTWIDWAESHKLSWANWFIADKSETSAALKLGADPVGGWKDTKLTTVGKYIRNLLLELNSN